MIRFQCPHCQATLEAADRKAGAKILCPGCKQRLQIPRPPASKTVRAPLISAPRKRSSAARAKWPLYLALAVGGCLIAGAAFLAGTYFSSANAVPPSTSQARASTPSKTDSRIVEKKTDRADSPPQKVGGLPKSTEGTQKKAIPQAELPPVEKKGGRPQKPRLDEEIIPPVLVKPRSDPAVPVKPRSDPAVNPNEKTPKPDGPPASSTPQERPQTQPEELGGLELAGPTRSRTVEQIKQALKEINAAPREKLSAAAAKRAAALRRLQSYRYLVGVPHANLVLDEELNGSALAAARICAKLGRNDHNPPNPGLPEEEYQVARKGAARSNLHMDSRSGASLSRSIDAYMDDSDPTNIARVGHRRWCLNPHLRKVGFGQFGKHFAMWAHDTSQPTVPAYDVVAYPSPGLTPLEFFGSRYAWSLSLNPKKYATPDDAVKVSVFPTDEAGKKSGAALALDYMGIDTTRRAIPNCIVFRPKGKAVAAGKRYLVEIQGIRDQSGKPAGVVRYAVQFVRLGAIPGVDPLPEMEAGGAGRSFVENRTGHAIEVKLPGAVGRLTLPAGKTLTVHVRGARELPWEVIVRADPAVSLRGNLRGGRHYVITAGGKSGYKIAEQP